MEEVDNGPPPLLSDSDGDEPDAMEDDGEDAEGLEDLMLQQAIAMSMVSACACAHPLCHVVNHSPLNVTCFQLCWSPQFSVASCNKIEEQ